MKRFLFIIVLLICSFINMYAEVGTYIRCEYTVEKYTNELLIDTAEIIIVKELGNGIAAVYNPNKSGAASSMFVRKTNDSIINIDDSVAFYLNGQDYYKMVTKYSHINIHQLFSIPLASVGTGCNHPHDSYDDNEIYINRYNSVTNTFKLYLGRRYYITSGSSTVWKYGFLEWTIKGSSQYVDLYIQAVYQNISKYDSIYRNDSTTHLSIYRRDITRQWQPEVVHDTVYQTIHDTISVRDTLINHIHDTTYTILHDTAVFIERDTITQIITRHIYDTLSFTNTIYDTVYQQIHDTVIKYDIKYQTVYIYDTIYTPTDTFIVYEPYYDTVYQLIHDTVYNIEYDTVIEIVEQIIYIDNAAGLKYVEYTEGKDFYFDGMNVVNMANLNLYLYSMDGKLIEIFNGTNIMMSNYPNGMYIVTDNNKRYIKVII